MMHTTASFVKSTSFYCQMSNYQWPINTHHTHICVADHWYEIQKDIEGNTYYRLTEYGQPTDHYFQIIEQEKADLMKEIKDAIGNFMYDYNCGKKWDGGKGEFPMKMQVRMDTPQALRKVWDKIKDIKTTRNPG